MDLDDFRTDAGLESEGVWVPVAGGDGTARLKLTRIGNPRYRELLQARLKPWRRAMRGGGMSDAATETIMAEVLAETVLLDWRGLELGGETLPYSRENAVKLLRDPRLRDFRDMVVELASEMELYRERGLAESEKNLPTASPGNSAGAAARRS